MKEYHINLFYSAEDKCWIADIPDLRFCSACGSTPAEALGEVQKAKQAWLRVARDRGKRIPKPRYRPAIYQANR
jgi:predicted RNase H-like HicB family nuclease